MIDCLCWFYETSHFLRNLLKIMWSEWSSCEKTKVAVSEYEGNAVFVQECDTHRTSGSMNSLKQLILINHQHTKNCMSESIGARESKWVNTLFFNNIQGMHKLLTHTENILCFSRGSKGAHGVLRARESEKEKKSKAFERPRNKQRSDQFV